MKKDLSKMTLTELWQLFPIFLTAHQSQWDVWYNEELEYLKSALPMENIVRISHIGSTAINEIWAKPIIDILVEIKARQLVDLQPCIEQCGYLLMNSNAERMSFNKGYTPKGFAPKVYHLHLRYQNDNDELYFRDYLNEHPEVSKEYEQMKIKLWKQYEYNRDGYTEAKTAFIKAYTDKAKLAYSCRWFSD